MDLDLTTSLIVTRTSESKVDYFDRPWTFGPPLQPELSDPTQAETMSFDLPRTYHGGQTLPYIPSQGVL